jgi:MFS family permease
MAMGNLAGAIPAGKLIRRIGLRRALLMCFLLAPLILCARSLFTSYSLQLAIAALTGMALSLWAVCIPPTIAATTSEQGRPFAFSLFFSIGIGVSALGALTAGRLPSWFAAHQFRVTTLLPEQLTLIACCCLAMFGVVPTLALKARQARVSLGHRPLFSPSLFRFLAAVGLWGVVSGSFVPFANLFFAGHLHAPLPQIGTIFFISQLVQVAAVLCAPFLFKRWGVLAGIISAQSAIAVCLLSLAAISDNLWIAACFYIALTGAQWMNEPGIYSALMGLVPEEHRGGASSSMSFTLSCSQLVAASIAGWAYKTIGYPPTLCIIALVALAAAGMFGSLSKEDAPFVVAEGQAD